MNVDGNHYRTIWPAGDGWRVMIVDQTLLPFEFKVVQLESLQEAAHAIAEMLVRGAPLIGATTAYGIALAMHADPTDASLDYASELLLQTRPTAVNLRWALDEMRQLLAALPLEQREQAAYQRAAEICDDDVAMCSAIGDNGHVLIADLWDKKDCQGQVNILTHCNAGWLAAVDWGTALSGIYCLARRGESPFVWVDETRPRLQGMRLTAWELMQEGIACRVQADNAAAWMMAQGKVDTIVVGADRVAANGDVANKIGTYMLSLAAREHGVPMYVAAPSSTFDPFCKDGGSIPIEERQEEEVLEMDGLDERSNVVLLRIAPVGAAVNNPAFDVTPVGHISAIVSENGIWRPE